MHPLIDVKILTSLEDLIGGGTSDCSCSWKCHCKIDAIPSRLIDPRMMPHRQNVHNTLYRVFYLSLRSVVLCLIHESYRQKIWYDALYGIPRLNTEQWNTLDLFGRWLVAIRVAVLLMTAFATFISRDICLSTRQILICFDLCWF